MSRATNYLAKHRLLTEQYKMCLSVAREYLYSRSIVKLKHRSPAVLSNCFLLRYPAALLRTRITDNGCIVVDHVPYQVVYEDCTPASITKNNLEVWASFRRFQDDFGLPATVIVYPVHNTLVGA